MDWLFHIFSVVSWTGFSILLVSFLGHVCLPTILCFGLASCCPMNPLFLIDLIVELFCLVIHFCFRILCFFFDITYFFSFCFYFLLSDFYLCFFRFHLCFH